MGSYGSEQRSYTFTRDITSTSSRKSILMKIRPDEVVSCSFSFTSLSTSQLIESLDSRWATNLAMFLRGKIYGKKRNFFKNLQLCVVKAVDGVVRVAGNLLKALLELNAQTAKALGQKAVKALISSLLGTAVHNHVAELCLKK